MEKKANRDRQRLFTTVRGFSRRLMSSSLAFGKVWKRPAGSTQPSGSRLGETLPTYAGTTFQMISLCLLRFSMVFVVKRASVRFWGFPGARPNRYFSQRHRTLHEKGFFTSSTPHLQRALGTTFVHYTPTRHADGCSSRSCLWPKGVANGCSSRFVLWPKDNQTGSSSSYSKAFKMDARAALACDPKAFKETAQAFTQCSNIVWNTIESHQKS